MSLDATIWAWRRTVGRSSAKLVLLSIADRADEKHHAYPSISRLALDTELDRKTVLSCISYLEEAGVIESRRSHGKATHYRLIGVDGREDSTSTKSGTSTKNGTQPVPNLGHEPPNELKGGGGTRATRFDEFWELWPDGKRKGKRDAQAAWIDSGLDGLADTIIADVRRRKTEDDEWVRGFSPAPAKYLAGHRWEDDIAHAKTGTSSNGRHPAHQSRATAADKRAAIIGGYIERGLAAAAAEEPVG